MNELCSEETRKKCVNFYKESFLNRKEYINQLENNWKELKEWIKNRKEECKCNNDVYRFTAYDSVLNKMKEIKEGKNE